MTNLQTLSDKLYEYNQTHSTAWAILLCTPRVDEVFIVDEEENQLSPEWWPLNSTGETIEKALELVPKEPKYVVTIYTDNKHKTLVHNFEGVSKDYVKKIFVECS